MINENIIVNSPNTPLFFILRTLPRFIFNPIDCLLFPQLYCYCLHLKDLSHDLQINYALVIFLFIFNVACMCGGINPYTVMAKFGQIRAKVVGPLEDDVWLGYFS